MKVIFGLPYSGKSFFCDSVLAREEFRIIKVNEHDFYENDYFNIYARSVDDIISKMISLSEIYSKICFDSLSFILYYGESLRSKGVSNDLIVNMHRMEECAKFVNIDLAITISPFSSDKSTIEVILPMIIGCTRDIVFLSRGHEFRYLTDFIPPNRGLDLDKVLNFFYN